MTTPAKAAAYTARLSRRPSLSHLLGVNGFFTALLGQARRDQDLRLVQRWSERTIASWFPLVHPDGLGLWHDYGDEIAFFLEYDTGTEDHGRLIDKLTGYEHLTQVGPTYQVLFCLPSREREGNLHTNLAGHHGRVTVATAVHPLPDPSDAVWAIVGHRTANRARLADLASDHGPANPGNPVYRSGFIDPPGSWIAE